MSNTLFSFLAWTFLPDFVTSQLQNFYYGLTIRAGEPKPQPGSADFARHRRRIYVCVVLVYLAYTLYEAHWDVRRVGDFYSDLGVPHDVDERALQTRFRRLTVLHHPDKIAAGSEHRARAEQYYVHLKLARDTLLDPAKRFAYDRFGPDITQWHQCITAKDFLMTGLKGLGPFYAASGLFMLFLGFLGFFDWGKYWRYLLFVSLGLFELYTITRPSFPIATVLPTLLNPLIATARAVSPLPFLKLQQPYLPFQALRVAHSATITLLIASSRLGPILEGSGSDSVSSSQKLELQMQRLEQLASANVLEATRLHALELVPFKSGASHDEGGAALHTLKNKVQQWFTTNTVRSEKDVQEAVGRVVEQRRQQSQAAEE